MIDYVSGAMDENGFEELFKGSLIVPGQQAQKFNRLMIYGLSANGAEVRAVTGRPVTKANHRGLFLRKSRVASGGVEWVYGSVLNLPVVKNVWQMASVYRSVRGNAKRGGAVVVDVLNASVAYGASLAAKRKHIPCIGIVTDLPEQMVTGTRKGHVRLVRKVLKNCTGYVFLTEAMNGAVNPEHKPYTVIEALCDAGMKSAARTERGDVRKCIYAGFLDRRYGVGAMVEGFIMADLPDAELHIYGYGPFSDELREITAVHRNVVYHGTVMNDVIVKEELGADLLINPRPTGEEFTRYSFPSKNVEYMVSGTPVLTTKLPGMPEDYYPFVYIAEDESAEGLCESFRRVLGLPAEELEQKGKEAKKFVLEKKNNVSQAAKLIRLIGQAETRG
ncbi:MAG: glycosyltransferase [Clostridia bacterium]|nr:glycosyltransferase [Clostridia bacterium]